jgi:hypothetical protein
MRQTTSSASELDVPQKNDETTNSTIEIVR